MIIKHYPEKHLSEIRQRLKLILELSHKNRLASNDVASSELMADDIPHARRLHLEIARSIRKQIKKREEEIQSHKKWIKKKSSRFFKRISFVRQHITTWDLDMPSIRFAPVRPKPLKRKKNTRLTLGERQYSLAKRCLIMNQWYVFFFGEDHLKPSPWHEPD